MTINKSNGKFYVVGGPVQPGRECHVLRDADATLYARLTEGEYCHVLAPSHEGKTTLMAQTAGRLRDDGVRVATIDLAQISSREIQDDVGRWYYSFAYRIVRELRIRSDMQSWWQERSGLTIMQRLREFFLEVVLHDTDEPVVIFIDGMEAALGQEFADQLLAAIRACYDTRATEPAYQRLTFALLGSVAVGQRIPRGHDSPFDISQPVKLNDFEPDEVRRLAAGLHLDSLVTEQIAEAVWDWTGGQPYLCQKIYRALARRKSASLTQQVVDQVVEALFLGPASTREEPHLSAVAKDVLRETSGYSARLSLYRRIRRGRKVLADRAMDVHRDLLRSGIVSIDEDGQFCIRNRVYSAVFTNSWVRHNQPLGWRAAAIAATLAVVFIAGPVWYTQYLPKAYRQSLSDPAEDYVSALESYRRMSFLPGFEAEADQLFADYLVSQSRRARRIAEVERLGESLTDIPGWETAGEGLRDEYWSRRTITSMRRGERDSALIYALRTLDASEAGGRNLVAELLGNDLDKLYGTVRTAKPLQALELDTVSGVIATLDDQHRVEVFHLTDSGPQRIQRLSLLAEEVVPLQRRVIVEGAGTGKRLILTAQVAHPRPADVLLELRSPSGREVALALSPNDLSDAQGIYRFDSRNDARLRTLLDENINGTWTARFSDNAQGIVGNLVDWEMSIDGKVAIAPAGYISEVSVIPEPRVARTIRSVLSPDGRRALTWPADELVRGDILVWDIGNGEVIARIPRSAGFSSASFMLGHSGVFMIAGSAVELWDIETSELRKRILIGPAFEPVLSGNGRHLIIDTVLEAGDNALSVWDMTEVVETGQLITGGVADLVAADPNGKLMAVSDGDRLVRLWSVADGELIAEFEHGARPLVISFDKQGRWLVTEDAAHALRVWDIRQPERPVLTRYANSRWDFNINSDVLLLGSLDRGYEWFSLSEGRRKGSGFSHGVPRSRKLSSRYTSKALLAAEHAYGVTYDGRQALKFWRLPPRLQSESADSGQRAAGSSVAGNVAAISRDGRMMALGMIEGDVKIIPAEQQALVLSDSKREPDFIGHLDPITVTAFSQKGSLAASGSLDGGVRVWDATTGAPHEFFSGHLDGAVQALAFSADDQFVFSASRSSVLVTEVATGNTLEQLQIQSEKPQLLVSDDGQRVYVAGDRGGLTRWLWQSNITETLIAPNAGVLRVAVSADEQILATVDEKRQLRLWDAGSMVSRESRVTLPAASDYLSINESGDRVTVQSGLWLHSIAVEPDGVHFEVTRMLSAMPVSIEASPQGEDLFVLTQQSTSVPRIEKINLLSPKDAQLNESPEQLTSVVESALSLTLDKFGDAQALYPR